LKARASEQGASGNVLSRRSVLLSLQIALASVAIGFSGTVCAQEIELIRPLKPTTTRLVIEAIPAEWEWVYWASAGASRVEPETWRAIGAIGAELTFGAMTYRGFPSGPYGAGRGKGQLRVGPWAAASTRNDGGVVEGGLTLDWGAVYHASFGTFDARLGGGYGAFAESRHPHGVITLAYGVRSAQPRYQNRDSVEPRPTTSIVAMASVARLFVTYRRALPDGAGSELGIGLELSPSFLLPPYSWFRLLGGPERRHRHWYEPE
jgi:hypothetical protein